MTTNQQNKRCEVCGSADLCYTPTHLIKYCLEAKQKQITNQQKKTYPKINGKQLDEIHKKEFDAWVKEYEEVIRISRPELTPEQRFVCAYNCAFSTVTNSIYKFDL